MKLKMTTFGVIQHVQYQFLLMFQMDMPPPSSRWMNWFKWLRGGDMWITHERHTDFGQSQPWKGKRG